MLRLRPALALALALLLATLTGARSSPIENPAIDMAGFLRLSQEAAQHRASRRLSEADFMRMAAEPGTLVLDARSKEKYELLHVAGAVNLSFPDITLESLQRIIPDTTTPILIYCNNNFRGADQPFPSKLPTASLNLSTYIALYAYGYRNVFELGPLIDATSSKLPLVAGPSPQSRR